MNDVVNVIDTDFWNNKGPATAVVRVDGAGGSSSLAHYDVRALVLAGTDRLLEDYRRERVEVRFATLGVSMSALLSVHVPVFVCLSVSVSVLCQCQCVCACVSACSCMCVSVWSFL